MCPVSLGSHLPRTSNAGDVAIVGSRTNKTVELRGPTRNSARVMAYVQPLSSIADIMKVAAHPVSGRAAVVCMFNSMRCGPQRVWPHT